MATLTSWLSSGSHSILSAEDRAALAWRRINHRPTEITIRRGNGSSAEVLDEQTVRVEWDNAASINDGINTTRGTQRVVIFGIRDHAKLPDTDIRRGDQFSLNGVRYDVLSIMTPPGEVQAVCDSGSAAS